MLKIICEWRSMNHLYQEMLSNTNFLTGKDILLEKGLLDKAMTIKNFPYVVS